ncbi:MAG: chromate transporter [Sphaerochaetaceae bacterium]|nr:chromate transporter [Sphaerochaetaceae bacterium]
MKKYWKLFRIMFTLSLFTFGGGYVIVSLMKERFVDELKWIDEEEMLNIIAIAQSSPGAVAVNGSVLVGYKIGKMRGAAVSLIATILPPFLIISIISVGYSRFSENPLVKAFLRGLQPAVAAVIADVVVSLGINVIKKKEVIYIIMMVLSFVVIYFGNVNVMFVILVSALIGFFYSRLSAKGEKRC